MTERLNNVERATLNVCAPKSPSWILFLLVLLSAVSASRAFAADVLDRPIDFDIPAQSAESALIEFSKQANVQVLLRTTAVASQKTNSVKGRLTVTTALSQLLKQTNLTYEAVGNAVAIKAAASRADAATQDRSRVGDAPARSTVDAHVPASSLDEWRDAEHVDEIIVTGSRLRTSGEHPATVTVFDRDKINELGVSSVANVLAYLPQQPYTDLADNQFGGGLRFVRLRGLSVDHTLLLINGRRAFPGATQGSVNAFDLNSIPLALVERIEVMSDSGSAVYGTDAISGVVNIILKRDVSRPVLEVHYGAANGGAVERQASFSLGHSTARFRISGMVDYFDRDSLPGIEREIHSNQDYRRFGSIDRRTLTTHPANITSRTTANLPGLPSRFATVPTGGSGVELTPADFLGTAGQRNFDSLGRWFVIMPEARRRGAALFAEADMTEKVTIFGDVLYTNTTTRASSSPPSFSGTVPGTNPFNPFGVAVTANYLFTELGPSVGVHEVDGYRAVAGIQGKLGSWDGELSVLRSDYNGANREENTVDSASVALAVNSTDPARALNFFRDGPSASPEVLATLLHSPAVTYSSTGTQATGFIRGDLFQLPTGAVTTALGGEWREERMQNSNSGLSADRTVSAGFFEVRVPLIGRNHRIPARMPAARSLQLTAAGRYDRYSDFGSTFNPQIGLSWRPFAPLLIHASYGESFRAPALTDLHTPQLVVSTPVTDPQRSNETVDVLRFSGGNPGLDPTQAESLSFGFVLTPSAVAGLRVSANYWRIKMDDRVFAYSPAQILANEHIFPGRIVRAEPSPADTAAGLPGRLISVDTSRVNFGPLETSGIDVSLSSAFNVRSSNIVPSLSVTWVDKYESIEVPGQPPVNRVGIASRFGSIPEWRAVAGVRWSWNALSASTAARYIPAYDDDSPSNLGNGTGRRIPSQTLVDASVVIDLEQLNVGPSSVLSGMKLTFGAFNLFDEEPHFTETQFFGYDLSQGDIRQRFGYVNLSKSF